MIDPVSASGGAWALTSAQRPQPPRMEMQAALAPVAETLGFSVEAARASGRSPPTRAWRPRT